jgi:hypothetical protein
VLGEEAVGAGEVGDDVLAPGHAVALVGDQHVLDGDAAGAQRGDDLVGLVLRRDRIADALVDEDRGDDLVDRGDGIVAFTTYFAMSARDQPGLDFSAGTAWLARPIAAPAAGTAEVAFGAARVAAQDPPRLDDAPARVPRDGIAMNVASHIRHDRLAD